MVFKKRKQLLFISIIIILMVCLYVLIEKNLFKLISGCSELEPNEESVKITVEKIFKNR